jgi:hypothetical protein
MKGRFSRLNRPAAVRTAQSDLACTTVPAAIYADVVSTAHRPRHARPSGPRDGFDIFRAGFTVFAVTAGLGLVIYLIVAGTNPQRDLALLAGLIFLLARTVSLPDRDAGLAWIVSGALLSETWQIVRDVGHGRGWPTPEVAAIASAGDWIRWTAVACGAIGIVVGIRSGTLTWPPWRDSA